MTLLSEYCILGFLWPIRRCFIPCIIIFFRLACRISWECSCNVRCWRLYVVVYARVHSVPTYWPEYVPNPTTQTWRIKLFWTRRRKKMRIHIAFDDNSQRLRSKHTEFSRYMIQQVIFVVRKKKQFIRDGKNDKSAPHVQANAVSVKCSFHFEFPTKQFQFSAINGWSWTFVSIVYTSNGDPLPRKWIGFSWGAFVSSSSTPTDAYVRSLRSPVYVKSIKSKIWYFRWRYWNLLSSLVRTIQFYLHWTYFETPLLAKGGISIALYKTIQHHLRYFRFGICRSLARAWFIKVVNINKFLVFQITFARVLDYSFTLIAQISSTYQFNALTIKLKL